MILPMLVAHNITDGELRNFALQTKSLPNASRYCKTLETNGSESISSAAAAVPLNGSYIAINSGDVIDSYHSM